LITNDQVPSAVKKTEKPNFIVRVKQIYFKKKKNLVICFKIALYSLPSLKSHAVVSLISEISEENLVNVYKFLSIEGLEFFPFTSHIKMAIFSRIPYNFKKTQICTYYWNPKRFSKFFSSSRVSTESIGRNKRSTACVYFKLLCRVVNFTLRCHFLIKIQTNFAKKNSKAQSYGLMARRFRH
jgi:hypothetical protein